MSTDVWTCPGLRGPCSCDAILMLRPQSPTQRTTKLGGGRVRGCEADDDGEWASEAAGAEDGKPAVRKLSGLNQMCGRKQEAPDKGRQQELEEHAPVPKWMGVETGVWMEINELQSQDLRQQLSMARHGKPSSSPQLISRSPPHFPTRPIPSTSTLQVMTPCVGPDTVSSHRYLFRSLTLCTTYHNSSGLSTSAASSPSSPPTTPSRFTGSVPLPDVPMNPIFTSHGSSLTSPHSASRRASAISLFMISPELVMISRLGELTISRWSYTRRIVLLGQRRSILHDYPRTVLSSPPLLLLPSSPSDAQ